MELDPVLFYSDAKGRYCTTSSIAANYNPSKIHDPCAEKDDKEKAGLTEEQIYNVGKHFCTLEKSHELC